MGSTALKIRAWYQALFRDKTLSPVAGVMDRASQKGLRLSLFTSCPSEDENLRHVTFCLPLGSLKPDSPDAVETPAAVFFDERSPLW